MKEETRAVCTELCRHVLCASILIHEFFSYPESHILKTIQYNG